MPVRVGQLILFRGIIMSVAQIKIKIDESRKAIEQITEMTMDSSATPALHKQTLRCLLEIEKAYEIASNEAINEQAKLLMNYRGFVA